jgi:hypothetical protein
MLVGEIGSILSQNIRTNLVIKPVPKKVIIEPLFWSWISSGIPRLSLKKREFKCLTIKTVKVLKTLFIIHSHVSAESPSNIFPNPSEFISEVSEQ